MRLTISTVFLGLAFAAAGVTPAVAAETAKFVDGTHYTTLPSREPTITNDGTVEVAEIFAYSCPHCKNFEPALAHWLTTKADYVTFIRIPAAWGDPVTNLHAQAFYTAEELNKLDDMHEAFFKEFHDRRNMLETEDKIRAFFAKFGVDAETFDKTFNSFVVHTKVQRARDYLSRYQAMETPLIIVNGKYQARGQQAGNYGTWFAIIDELAAREYARQQSDE